ncbi:MAG: ROK family protein [Betaproteobacteria bacterium]|nr:ROK family protein [Betaproteobacteria bacterium]
MNATHHDDTLILALDIGGSKIRGALVDALGQARSPQTVTSLGWQGAAALLGQARALGESLLAATPPDHRVIACGISSAGVIDIAGARVTAATGAIPGWAGTDLGAFARDAFNLPAFAANDGPCALWGEVHAGALRDASPSGTVVMLTLGTGVGGAVMHDGRMLTGRNGHAGHFGRTLMGLESLAAQTTLDHLVSGKALVDEYRRAAGIVVGGAEVFQFAAAGDDLARQVVAAWRGNLAQMLINLHWGLDPAVVILGGGVIGSRAHWWTALIADLARQNIDLPLVPATLGNDAGMLGAAWRARQQHASEYSQGGR